VQAGNLPNPFDSFSRRLTGEAERAKKAVPPPASDEIVDPYDSFTERLEEAKSEAASAALRSSWIEPHAAVHLFMLGYFHKAVSDLDEKRLAQRAAGRGHSPRWIIGHLAVSADYGLMGLGGSRLCSEQWHKAFGLGSVETDDVAPPRGELIAALDIGYDRLLHAGREAAATTLDKPFEHPLFAGSTVRTLGHALTHLLTTHLAFHLGQLSAWRRQAGFPALF
jgi:DinB superfamily